MTRNQKLLSVFLALLMILTIFPMSIIADALNAAIITVESVNAVPGSNVEVDINVKNNPGIMAANFTVTYDEGLTLVDSKSGEAFGALSMTTPESYNSPCKFAWDALDLADDDIKDGTILTLTFSVDESVSANSKLNVKLSYQNGNIIDSDLNDIPVTINNGSVTIIDYIPGDINGDETVDLKDVTFVRRLVTGYSVTANKLAADVNGDGEVTMKDVVLIRRYVVDAEGYGVTLVPGGSNVHTHIMTATAAKAATCTEDGNIAYWYCSACEKYFTDKDGNNFVSQADTILKAPGHTVVIDAAVEPTYDSTGLTEGSHCSVCKTILKKQDVIPKLKKTEYAITYYISNGDEYLAQQEIQNDNPATYTSEQGVSRFTSPSVPGYKFLGWYNLPSGDAAENVKSIPVGTTGNIDLYARWSEESYKVTYKLYQTPLADSIDEKYCSYTISKGLTDLPNPKINNYVFLGWYTNDGVEVTDIPIGTSGDIVLNAYWTSKRNLAKASTNSEDPIVMEDTDNGVLYYAYELGTIENIPLSENIWTLQSVSGLAQQKSESITTSLSQSKADSISNTISNSTIDSGTWTLSEGWNNTTSVTEEWAEQHNTTVQEATEKCKTSSNTINIADSNGGSGYKTTTDGTTTVTYDSQNYTHGNSAEFGAKVSGSYSNEHNLSSKIMGDFSLSAEISGGYKQQQETNEHTGTDKTKVDTTVDSSSSTWNHSETSSNTNSASVKTSVSKALSEIISNKKGYGSSYTKNGQNSQSQGFSVSKSNSINSSSTLTWSSTETHTVTNTYSTDGKSEGCYRLVIAGKAHVYGVVGYDIATKSYFTYTYSIMDDKQYEFLDYSPDNNFNDYDNSVLPFEIPYYVYEHSTAATVRTEGLTFKTNSTTNTATVTDYKGTSLDVIIPNYITSGGVAYKVTGISANAFAGKNIRSIILSKFIKELPDRAFKNCDKLEQISGYYNVIGNEAFGGCNSLEKYNVTQSIMSIGKNAFLGVSDISVKALSQEYSLEYSDNDVENAKILTQSLIDSAISSGANSISINLEEVVEDCEFSLSVPSIDYFELQGGKNKSFNNLQFSSKAQETVIRNITVNECKRIPLEICSEKLTMDTVQINSQGYCLMLLKETEISLIRDNSLNSANGKSLVCKNPKLVSISSDGVAGFLEIAGNVYVFGKVTGIEEIDVKAGEILYITEDDFNKFIKGSYDVSFDVNGGNELSKTEKTVYFGSSYGELPTPTKDYYTFDGWYTTKDGGDKITESSIFDCSENITLYAHWELKPLSGWVKASEVPTNAKAVNIKWNYKYTSTGALSGSGNYTVLNSSSYWSSYGSWSGWSTNSASGSDSRQVETKTVTDRNAYTNYKYYIYRTSDGYGYGTQGYQTSRGACTRYDEINLTYALPLYNSGLGLYGPYDSSMFSHGYDCYWFSGGSSYVPAVTHTEYRYRDRHMIYTYTLESSTNPNGQSGVSDIVEYVQYREK